MIVAPLEWARGRVTPVLSSRPCNGTSTDFIRKGELEALNHAPPSQELGRLAARGREGPPSELGAGDDAGRPRLCLRGLAAWAMQRCEAKLPRRRHASARLWCTLGTAVMLFACVSGCNLDYNARAIAAQNVIAATSTIVNNMLALLLG